MMVQHSLHRSKEKLHYTEAQQHLAETTSFERAQRNSIDDLTLLLRFICEDANLSGTVLNLPLDSLFGDNTNKIISEELFTSQGVFNAKPLEVSDQLLKNKPQSPLTLISLSNALQYAYGELRTQQISWKTALNGFHSELAERDDRILTLESSEQHLRKLLQAEQEREKHWRGDANMLVERKSLKELITDQKSLLQTVTKERDTFQKQWLELNQDYIAMERRNGILHERCSEKEYENARLTALVESLRSASRSRVFFPSTVSPVGDKVLHTYFEVEKPLEKGKSLSHEDSVD
ncbi:unnamed protein product [Phytomonas sp. Hart1]|nr:unnamed protein product [Phytomonas sp. Hart1]|eukprot:CCW69531.1 unnamed protein product [Phytomonas sp. isolate Hart1]